VDSEQCYERHYRWVKQHPFNGKIKPWKRVTLKSEPLHSFQPQTKNQELIDIVPFLINQGISLVQLRNSISFYVSGKMARTSKPMQLNDNLANALYAFLSSADIKLYGKDNLINKQPN
jgi:hypothetical protein